MNLKQVSKLFLFVAIMFYAYASAILVFDFFKPVDEGRGTGMSSLISVGQEAIVDQPAQISFFSWEGYTVEQRNQDGTVVTHETPNIHGRRYLVVTTNQPTTWLVTKAPGGMDDPLISIDSISDQHPSLYIHRTWYKPLVQLFRWYLFLAFLFPVSIGTIFLVGYFISRK